MYTFPDAKILAADDDEQLRRIFVGSIACEKLVPDDNISKFQVTIDVPDLLPDVNVNKQELIQGIVNLSMRPMRWNHKLSEQTVKSGSIWLRAGLKTVRESY